MKLTLTLPNARIYGVTDFMVKIGERFNLRMVKEQPGETMPLNPKWFSDNDPTLNIWTDTNGLGAAFEAKEAGSSVLLIIDENMQILRKMTITVVGEIPEEAEVLEVTTEVLPK